MYVYTVSCYRERRRRRGCIPTHWAVKSALIWSRNGDVNPIPTSPLADNFTTAPSRPVL